MIDRKRLAALKAVSVQSCDASKLRDIGEIEISNARSREDRLGLFLKLIGNPYLFRAGDTVVKIEYCGGREFGEAFADVLRVS